MGSEVVPDVRCGRLRNSGSLWQVVDVQGGEGAVLLLKTSGRGAPGWWDGELAHLQRSAALTRTDGLDGELLCMVMQHDSVPSLVSDLPRRDGLLAARDIGELGKALASLMARRPTAALGGSLFFPSAGCCLALEEVPASGEDRHALAVSLLTGGVADPGLSRTQIKAINPWLTNGEIGQFFIALRLDQRRPNAAAPARTAADFVLPGQPALERLLREHILDYVERREAYATMRVAPPNGVLLVGAPGTGKTHATRKLAEFLDWPVFDVDIAAVGSPYIHETSRRLAKVFDDAATRAPSIVLLEELDALGQEREAGGQGYKIEEVGQLLRLIEDAGERGILVIGTSNRVAAIDPALTRRGRFDHVFEVKAPDEEQVRLILHALLAERPAAAGINIDDLARKLAGRPVSDLRWVVDDAARAAVRSGKTQIDDLCLFGAVQRLGSARK